MNTVSIEVNGEAIEVQENLTIQDFLDNKKIAGKMFVVEKNLKIVQKHEYSSEHLAKGDKIEIAGFFGGG